MYTMTIKRKRSLTSVQDKEFGPLLHDHTEKVRFVFLDLLLAQKNVWYSVETLAGFTD